MALWITLTASDASREDALSSTFKIAAIVAFTPAFFVLYRLCRIRWKNFPPIASFLLSSVILIAMPAIFIGWLEVATKLPENHTPTLRYFRCYSDNPDEVKFEIVVNNTTRKYFVLDPNKVEITLAAGRDHLTTKQALGGENIYLAIPPGQTNTIRYVSKMKGITNGIESCSLKTKELKPDRVANFSGKFDSRYQKY